MLFIDFHFFLLGFLWKWNLLKSCVCCAWEGRIFQILPPVGTGEEGLSLSLLPPCNGVDLASKVNGNSHTFKKMTTIFFNQKFGFLWLTWASLTCKLVISVLLFSSKWRKALCGYCASMTKEKRCFHYISKIKVFLLLSQLRSETFFFSL